MIPGTAMFIVDSGATWTWNNASGAISETFDGLAGGGTINKNLPNYTFTINANNNDNEDKRVFTGTLSGMAGSLTLGGTGTQEFRGASVNFTNATNLNSGTLKLTNASAWNSPVTFAYTNNSMVLALNTLSSSDSWTFNQAISGGGTASSIVKSGPGTVTLTPTAGSYFTGSSTAAIAVAAGKLYLDGSLGANPAVSVAALATFGGTAAAGAQLPSPLAAASRPAITAAVS